MKAFEFIDKLAEITPDYDKMIKAGTSPEVAEANIRHYNPRQITYDYISTGNEILDLRANYDVANMLLGMEITFDPPITEFYTFPVLGLGPVGLLILDESDQSIHELSSGGDYVNPVAESPEKLLDAFFIMAHAESKSNEGEDDNYEDYNEYKLEVARKAAEAAGGEAYFPFFQNMIGADWEEPISAYYSETSRLLKERIKWRTKIQQIKINRNKPEIE